VERLELSEAVERLERLDPTSFYMSAAVEWLERLEALNRRKH
jgi:hypothetical protein